MGRMCNSEKVVYQKNIFPMGNNKEIRRVRFILESQLENGNNDSTTIDTHFPILYSETKQPYRGGFGV